LFFWLGSDDLAVSRVARKEKEGGHHKPEDVICKRYKSDLRIF
jgi:predicted ABC-type ATPase